MSGAIFDVIIVGQGLAGTTLAWHLVEAGQSVLVLDAGEASTASKISAGLITPITGKRLSLSWRDDAEYDHAAAFYRRIAQRTGQPFFHTQTAVRLLGSDQERTLWAQRIGAPAFARHLLQPQPPLLLPEDVADTRSGGFEMHAAQVDVPTYLAAARAHLDVRALRLDWHTDVRFSDGLVELHGLRARRLISCEGFAATRNPFFADVPFRAAKGEILTVRFARDLPRQSLHRGIWLAPTAAADTFLAGATFEWHNLDTVPTAAGRAEIEAKIRAFVRLPYTVVDHRAAVRPIISGRTVRLGLHRAEPRLGYFNGLASKGVLKAPWYARLLAESLVTGRSLPEAVDIRSLT